MTAQKISLSPRLQFEAYVHQLASDRSSPLEIHVSLNDMNNTYDVDYNYGRLLGWTPRIASANAIVAMHISVKKCIRSRCVDCPSRSFINALLQIIHGASFANNAVSVNSLSQHHCCVVRGITIPPGAPDLRHLNVRKPRRRWYCPPRHPQRADARIRYPRQTFSSQSPPAWPQRGCTLPSVPRTGRSLVPYLPIRAPLGSRPSGAACSFHR